MTSFHPVRLGRKIECWLFYVAFVVFLSGNEKRVCWFNDTEFLQENLSYRAKKFFSIASSLMLLSILPSV